MFAKYLYNWDSVQFALALEHFSVADHAPHPPGYPLFVLTGKLFRFFLPDANAAFVTTACLFAIATLVLFYLLSRQFFSRAQSLALTVLYLSCPVFLGNSLVALSYTAEGFFGLALAYLAWLVIKSAKNGSDTWTRWLPITAAITAVALGYRQGVVTYFAPLYLYAIYVIAKSGEGKTGRKIFVLSYSAAIFILLTVAWFLPFLGLAGGWEVYPQAVNLQSRIVIWPNTLLGGGLLPFQLNIQVLLAVLLYGFPLGWVVILFYLARKKNLIASWKSLSGRFLWLWVTPALIFFAAVYIRRSGYVLVILPAFYLMLGWAWRRFSPAQRAGLWLVLLLGNLYAFFGLPQAPLSWGEIRRHDQLAQDRIELVRRKFDPKTTLVLASDDFNNGWRQAMYYLPEYYVVRHGWLAKEYLAGIPKLYYLASLDHPCYRIQEGYQHRSRYLTQLEIPPGTANLVLWDKNMADFCLSRRRLMCLKGESPRDIKLWYLSLKSRPAKIVMIPPYYFLIQTR